MPFTIIIRGPAGVGKSTVAERLHNLISNSVHLDIDKLKHMISHESSSARTKISHEVAGYFLKQLIKNKFNIIIEEIFPEEYYENVTKILKKSKYQLLKVYLTAPLNILIQRDANRKTKNKGKEVIVKLKKEILPLNEDMVIDTSKHTVEDTVNQIMLKIKELSF